MSFFENTRKPIGLSGKMMVSMMNIGHRALANWGFQWITAAGDAAVLDCGCGGGANIQRLLKRCPDGTVKGIDYSEVSVQKSREVNSKAINSGRCAVLQASVTQLPFEAERFDWVTAFETIYFWPDLPRGFQEVRRVLKPGGAFLICNECGGDNAGDEKWTKKIAGMVIYKDIQLKDALEQAGFTQIQIHKNSRGWLCVTGRK